MKRQLSTPCHINVFLKNIRWKIVDLQKILKNVLYRNCFFFFYYYFLCAKFVLPSVICLTPLRLS